MCLLQRIPSDHRYFLAQSVFFVSRKSDAVVRNGVGIVSAYAGVSMHVDLLSRAFGFLKVCFRARELSSTWIVAYLFGQRETS